MFLRLMPKLAPYHLEVEEIEPVLREHIKRTATFRYRGIEYPYAVIGREAVPAVPYFTSMYQGHNLLISEEAQEVPMLIETTLTHEVHCNRLDIGQGDYGCAMIENRVLSVLEPFESILRDVIAARLRMFRALIPYNKIDPRFPKNAQEQGILDTRHFLENLARGKGIEIGS
jgi:hypothetical protein